jgi:uncharacterized Zn-binding protein involved in type VI secretion
MTQITRLNDVTDHGGKVIESSSNTFVNARGVARIGDMVDCPIHGPNKIIGPGNAKVFVNGKNISHVGDMTECGSTIISGSTNSIS